MRRQFRLAGATVLVTGASSGIGRAVALQCAAAGSRVVLAGRDRARLDEVARVTGGVPVVADIATPEGTASLVADAGPVDVLVCSAGVGISGPFDVASPSAVADMLQVNVRAVMDLVRAVLPAMRVAGRGHVVVISSVAARLPVADEAAYGAGKAAVDQMAAALRMELAGTGVGVSAVAPAGVDTEFFARRGVPYQRRWPRPLSPATVANAVVRAIERDLPEVVVPGWLRLAYVVRAAAPRVYDRLSRRFG